MVKSKEFITESVYQVTDSEGDGRTFKGEMKKSPNFIPIKLDNALLLLIGCIYIMKLSEVKIYDY